VLALVIGVSLCVAGALAFGRANAQFYSQLAARGVRGEGVVVATAAADHNAIRYDYTVAGVRYHGAFSALPPNPTASELHPGDPVSIVYDRDNPGASCSCTPSDIAVTEWTSSFALAALAGALVIGFVLMLRWRSLTGERGSRPAA
jgi:hypothetical protein